MSTTIDLVVYSGNHLSHFVDGNVPVLVGYACGQGWSTQEINDTDNGPTSVYSTVSGGQLKIIFNGIQIATFGSGPAEFRWSIDDGPTTQARPLSGVMFDEGFPLFNSTVLDDMQHTLTIENLTGNISVGHSLVIPGSKTFVEYQPLRVDNTDPSITYKGNWTGIPSQRTSVTKGDSVLFGFCGSTLRVVGSYFIALEGNITLGFSVDNLPPEIRTFSDSMSTAGDVFVPYQVWFQSSSDCQHSINITVRKITDDGSFFSFSFFEYTAAFRSLSEAPSITVTPSSTPTSSIPSGPSSPRNGEPGGGSGPAQGHNRLVGPIVGGIAGGLVLVAGVIIAVFLLLRNKKATRDVGNIFTATPFIFTDKSDAPDFLPYDGYDRSALGPTNVSRRAGRTLAEKDRDRDLLQEAQTSAFQEAEIPQGVANDQPLSTSNDDPPTVVASPESAPLNRDSRDETRILSRRMLEMMQSLQSHVNELRGPPAYDEDV